MGFPGGSVVKNLPASAGDTGDSGSIPGSGRSPGGGHGNLLQYSCLGESREQKNLVGYCPWGHRESDTTEATEHARRAIEHTHTQTHKSLFIYFLVVLLL